MGKFSRDGKRSTGGFNRGFGRGKSFGSGRRFGDRDGGRPAMHQATCGECGASCEVPFKPTGSRPVFCNNCFKQQGGGDANRFGKERHIKSRFADRQMYEAVCAKCGNDCQVPFRPTAGKPVFCNNCFDRGGNMSATGSKDSREVMEQIKLLNFKIDKLTSLLTPVALKETGKKTEVKPAIVTKKTVPAKKEPTKMKSMAKAKSTKKKK